MQTRLFCLLTLLAALAPAQADLELARNGQSHFAILRQPDATEAEVLAAEELAQALRQITGAEFPIRLADENLPAQAIIVGPGPAAAKAFPDLNLSGFGPEECIRRSQGDRLVLAGGRPRGTLYAVNRFLQEECGVRWWTPWATRVPQQPNLRLALMDKRERPAFEYREPFWYHAFEGRWAVRNSSNGNTPKITPSMGGKIIYKGFVHTFYPLVPPEQHFGPHPEWYSLIDGKRTTDHAQLCLTNPDLREFLVTRVKEWLRQSPEAGILSVSQNDWHRPCQCEACKALDQAEGGHAGSLLAAVNYVAEKIGPDFPKVAIDTLAYQYTRQPPRQIKPLSNVIVRLCSIECNFAVPLSDPANTAFANDIRGWSKMCDRLYVWDYTTDFAHYIQPHPNWFSLGPNLRFFHQHNVRGVFEQGAYQSCGAEMAELRAWVLAQLLWNPDQDDRALIREFLEGYYGKEAAPLINEYLEFMADAARGYNLTCFAPTETPFFNFKPLVRAERLWQKAVETVRHDPEKLWRVRLGHLPVRYVWLVRWDNLRRECSEAGEAWPLPESAEEVAADWLSVATGPGPAGWTPITHLNEGGLKPQDFVARFKPSKP